MRTLNSWTESENEIIVANIREPLENIEKLIPSKSRKQILYGMRRLGYDYRLEETRKNANTTLRLSETEKAYIAGIIDGEGTIALHKDTRRGILCEPRISIANSNRDLLEWLKHKLFSTAHITRFELYANNYDAMPLLKAVKPYLRIKKKQADLVLEFIDLRLMREHWGKSHTQRELEIVQEVYHLNTKPKLAKRVASAKEVTEYLTKHSMKAITLGGE